MSANVLVVYASHHGGTQGIAERIAATLVTSGVGATIRSAEEASHLPAADLAGYDGFVIGSALYAFRWVREATGFVRRNQALLASRPTWLFSSGPLGTDTVDAKGRDVREAAGPKELAELQGTIHPRDHRVFFGAYDPTEKPIGFMERITRLMPATRDLLPAGDFRDWPEIETWAHSIATELTRIPAAVS
jgi:menaquinone-dependent protoporphyrinogen oxidase